MLFDERADELGDFVLLVTRKLAGFLKDLAQLASGAFAALLHGVAAKEMFDGDVEQAGQLLDLVLCRSSLLDAATRSWNFRPKSGPPNPGLVAR